MTFLLIHPPEERRHEAPVWSLHLVFICSLRSFSRFLLHAAALCLCPRSRIPYSSSWSCWSLAASSCLPLSRPSSIWRASSWCCWRPFWGGSAGPSRRSSCRRQILVSAERTNASVSAQDSHVLQAFLDVVSHPGLQNPIDALYHLQPLMFIGLFPLFQYNEGECLSSPISSAVTPSYHH